MAQNSGDQFKWLGLLKWSLAHTDGTRPSDETPSPMSAEKRKFLESVMKDGIIDEGARMRTILSEVTAAMEPENLETRNEESLADMLEELGDIVEQIDYARAFMSMGGLPFLLGCACEAERVMPVRIRSLCLVILGTMAQNNTPVQEALFESDAMATLTGLYFERRAGDETDGGSFRGRIVRAVSCLVRGHEAAEEGFCLNGRCRSMIETGLGISSSLSGVETCLALKRKCLFLLRALLCSDGSSPQRLTDFEPCLIKTLDFIDASKEDDVDMRETSLQLLLQILEQNKQVRALVSQKDAICTLGNNRLDVLRLLPPGEDRDFAAVEIDLWRNLILDLNRAAEEPQSTPPPATPVLLLGGRPAGDVQTLPQ